MNFDWPLNVKVSRYIGYYGKGDHDILTYIKVTVSCYGEIHFTTNFRSRVVIGSTRFNVTQIDKEVCLGLVTESNYVEGQYVKIKLKQNSSPDRYIVEKVRIDDLIVPSKAPEIVRSQYYTFAIYRRLKLLLSALKENEVNLDVVKSSIKRDLHMWDDYQSKEAKNTMLSILSKLNRSLFVDAEIRGKMKLIKDQELILAPRSIYSSWV